MLFLALFVLAVLTICVFFVWPVLDGSSPNPVKRAIAAKAAKRTLEKAAVRGEAASAPRPESLEGVLVAQLMAGEITRNQYRKAIEGLAERDDERHPLAVPPEIGPADA